MTYWAKELSFQCSRIFLYAMLCCMLVACSDSKDSGYVPLPDPIVTIEEVAPSKEHPKGLYRVQMEDLLLELSREKQVLFRGKKPTMQPDIWVCWIVEEGRIIADRAYNCSENKNYLVTLQFRAERDPSRGHYPSLPDDFRTLSNYPDSFVYTLRPSEEFPDLQEFYVHKLKTAYEYVLTLDYEDQVTDRVGKQRVHCTPGFRKRAEFRGYLINNGECGYGVSISPHVHLTVTFDSYLMPQIKQFEQQIYQFVKSLIIKKGS